MSQVVCDIFRNVNQLPLSSGYQQKSRQRLQQETGDVEKEAEQGRGYYKFDRRTVAWKKN